MAKRLRNTRRRIHGGQFRKVQRDTLAQHTAWIVRLERVLDDDANAGIAMLPYYPPTVDAETLADDVREVGFHG